MILLSQYDTIVSPRQIKDEMAMVPDANQKAVIVVNAILKYVGVETQEDIDLLVSLFYTGQDDDDENL